MIIRLEPHLKECICTADTIPCSAIEFKDFCNQVTKDSGIKIEYGCDSLNRDNWCLDIMTNKDKVKKLRDGMNGTNNLVMSYGALMRKTDGRDGIEDDSEVFERVENARKMLRKLAQEKAVSKTKKKILVVSHHITLGLLLASACKKGSVLLKGATDSYHFTEGEIQPCFVSPAGDLFCTHN